MAPAGSTLPRNAAASTTPPIANAWPIAIGTSDLATALTFCCCIPSATAKSHHAWVDSVISAEEQHHPQRVRAHLPVRHCASEKQYESDDASPPSSRTWCARSPSNSTKNFSSIFIPPLGSASIFTIQLF